MTGKILGIQQDKGVIRANDGNRYAFYASEIQNAKNISDFIGSEVDFEIRPNAGQNLAIDIYITDFKSTKPQSNFMQNNFLQNIAKPNLAPVSQEIQDIKTKFFIFIAICAVGNILGGFGGIFAPLLLWALFAYFIAYLTLYSAMESMWEKAKSAILRDNFMAYLATLFFGFISLFIVVSIANANGENYDRNAGKVILALFCLIVWIGCLIYNIYLRYQIYKEVAYITNQPLFIVAFWCIITIFLSPIGFVLYIIAWIGVREIQQSTSADEYDKTEPKNEMQDYDNQAIVSENINNDSQQVVEAQQSIETNIDSLESNETNNNKIVIIVTLILFAVAIIAIIYNKTHNTTKMVATARSDIASAQKAIVAKVFADDIDVKKLKAPNGMEWGEWIMQVAGLDESRWKVFRSFGIVPIDSKTNKPCYNSSETPLLWINPRDGNMHFNPSKLSSNYGKKKGFCEKLRDSYANDSGNGDKVIPLAWSGEIEF